MIFLINSLMIAKITFLCFHIFIKNYGKTIKIVSVKQQGYAYYRESVLDFCFLLTLASYMALTMLFAQK